MARWKAVRVRQELVEEAQKELEQSQCQSLSEFVSDAIRLRLQKLAKERTSERLKQDMKKQTPLSPHQLLYTSKHIWVKLTPQGNVKLGVSNYFQSRFEGIVHVETFNVGGNVSKHKPFGMIETIAWWWIHDLYSPIDGKIVKVNKTIIEDPFILNADPYQWIMEVRPDDPEFDKERDKLLSSEEYKRLIGKLEGRPCSPISDLELSEIIEEIKRARPRISAQIALGI